MDLGPVAVLAALLAGLVVGERSGIGVANGALIVGVGALGAAWFTRPPARGVLAAMRVRALGMRGHGPRTRRSGELTAAERDRSTRGVHTSGARRRATPTVLRSRRACSSGSTPAPVRIAPARAGDGGRCRGTARDRSRRPRGARGSPRTARRGAVTTTGPAGATPSAGSTTCTSSACRRRTVSWPSPTRSATRSCAGRAPSHRRRARWSPGSCSATRGGSRHR